MTARPRTSDPFLATLRQHDPAAALTPTAPAVGDALDEIARAIMRQPTEELRGSRRRRPAPRLRVAFVVVALAVVVGGVATAAVALHAHTGLFPSGPNATVGGPGEELNLAAPDFPGIALKLSADIPYPSAYGSWRNFVVTEQEPGPSGASAGDQVTAGALRGAFAASAFCAWVQDWRQAKSEGNSAEAHQAASTIASAPSWSAVAAEDPHPSPSAANDPGAEPGTLFGWMLPYRNAVLSGDSAAVDRMLASGYGDGKCWLADPQWMSEFGSWSQLSPAGIASRYEQFLTRERS